MKSGIYTISSYFSISIHLSHISIECVSGALINISEGDDIISLSANIQVRLSVLISLFERGGV